MIQGAGIDVVEVSRMEETVRRWGDVFLTKIFTQKEIEYAQSRRYSVQHIAGRFAVKEAVAKALATGWSGGFRWKDVEVENDSLGKPSVRLYGHVRQLLEQCRVVVSISHSEHVVVAFAVIERSGG